MQFVPAKSNEGKDAIWVVDPKKWHWTPSSSVVGRNFDKIQPLINVNEIRLNLNSWTKNKLDRRNELHFDTAPSSGSQRALQIEEGPVPKYNSFPCFIFFHDMRLTLISLTFIVTIMSLKTSLHQLKIQPLSTPKTEKGKMITAIFNCNLHE